MKRTEYLDELFCKAVANCERVTCIRCPMFSLEPLKNENHCLISEMMKQVQMLKKKKAAKK